MVAAITAGALALPATQELKSASKSNASPIAGLDIPEAKPAVAINVTNDVVESKPTKINFIYNYGDGNQLKCPLKETVTIESADDSLARLSRKGVSPESLLYDPLLEGNLAFNSKTLGLVTGDYKEMRPGDQFDILQDCVLTSPTYEWPDEDTGFFNVSQQSENKTCQYDYNFSTKKVGPPHCIDFDHFG